MVAMGDVATLLIIASANVIALSSGMTCYKISKNSFAISIEAVDGLMSE